MFFILYYSTTFPISSWVFFFKISDFSCRLIDTAMIVANFLMFLDHPKTHMLDPLLSGAHG